MFKNEKSHKIEPNEFSKISYLFLTLCQTKCIWGYLNIFLIANLQIPFLDSEIRQTLLVELTWTLYSQELRNIIQLENSRSGTFVHFTMEIMTLCMLQTYNSTEETHLEVFWVRIKSQSLMEGM